MIEKAVGIIGLCTFMLFAGFITAKVGEIDLWIVFILVSLMAGYDFYLDIFKASNGNGKGPSD
ncbi:MAG: hypothetical protein JSU82_04985 [Rhodospirillales bacterium]|nr:MAG: hypothetical protein JSU82_04985 [Rhodospirillales bacterium]